VVWVSDVVCPVWPSSCARRVRSVAVVSMRGCGKSGVWVGGAVGLVLPRVAWGTGTSLQPSRGDSTGTR
jgi:hypothetical protein